MIQDLYVDGTSFASGWGRGLERHLFKTSTGPKSWADYLADSVNCDNLWNHSLVAKPMDMQFYDIQQFCKQYLNAFKTFDNLFVVVEFAFVTYRSFEPVKALEGEFKNENIYPVILSKAREMETGNYLIHYVRKSKDYLKPQEPIFSKVNPECLAEKDIKRIDELAANWLEKSYHDPYGHLIYAYNIIRQIKNFFKIHNIPFVMYSAAVSDKSPQKERIDFSLRTMQKDKRIVPLKEFTGQILSKKYSIEEYENHPDEQGHIKIASALYDWIVKHDLTKKPNSSIITV
jgi:hypothetical protein